MMQNFPVAAVSGLLVRKQVKMHLNSLIQSVSSDIIIEKTKTYTYRRVIQRLIHRCITCVNTVGQF